MKLLLTILIFLGVAWGQPICRATTDIADRATDAAGKVRSKNYKCPNPGITWFKGQAFTLIPDYPSAAGATVTFSTPRPLQKKSRGILVAIAEDDLDADTSYWAVWMSGYHQVMPSDWGDPMLLAKEACLICESLENKACLNKPLTRVTETWECLTETQTASCRGLYLYKFVDSGGKIWGPYFVLLSPPDFMFNPETWRLVPIGELSTAPVG